MSADERTPLPVGKRSDSALNHNEKPKVSSILVLATAGALIGSSFQFGYNNSVINTPSASIKEWIGSTLGQSGNDDRVIVIFSVVVSIWAIGGLLGSLTAGLVADRLGRRGAMMANNAFAIGAAVLVGITKSTSSVVPLVIGRFLSGINCGANTVLPTMYLSEVAPLHLRGAFGVMHQLSAVVGILLSQVVGLPSLFGNASLWPWALCMTAVPAVLQPLLLLFAPESPRFLLVTRQDASAAKHSLQRLRAAQGDEALQKELRMMEDEAEQERSAPSVGFKGVVKSSTLRKALSIAIILHLAQQLCGINAIFYYSTELFVSVGLSQQDSVYASIGTSGFLVLSTLVSIPLMERAGRRVLMLLGLGLVIIFEILLTISLSIDGKETVSNVTSAPTSVSLHTTSVEAIEILGIVAIVATVAAFAIGPGSIPWFYPAEIFPQGARGTAMSIGSAINWLANFTVGLSFEHLQRAIGSWCLLPFIVIATVCWFFAFFKMPETMNKSFNEIYSLWWRANRKK